MNALTLASHQVELLFVLCTLMSGRRKREVQDRLGRWGLCSVLLELAAAVPWGRRAVHRRPPAERLHGPDCECNPDSAFKVLQRLVMIVLWLVCDVACDRSCLMYGMIQHAERSH